MNTDWEALLVLAVIAAVFVGGLVWIVRAEGPEMRLLRRRLSSPQPGPAGTGVEQTVSGGPAGFAALLPRSHPASAGTVDPRPAVPAGLLFPAGVVLIPASREAHGPALLPSTTLAGLQPPIRRRVVFGA